MSSIAKTKLNRPTKGKRLVSSDRGVVDLYDASLRLRRARRVELDRRKARRLTVPKGPAQTPRRVRARSVRRKSRHLSGLRRR